VASYLRELGIRYAEITGEVKECDREKHVEEFNRGDNKVILLTAAGGEGLDFRGKENFFFVLECHVC
jgi:superfamily II DNA/RNA helicase